MSFLSRSKNSICLDQRKVGVITVGFLVEAFSRVLRSSTIYQFWIERLQGELNPGLNVRRHSTPVDRRLEPTP